MATSTTKTNKPINPRGNDQSPKGYNRAALYSGKALSFDGVNDKVEGSAPSLPTGANPFTTCFYYKETTTSNEAFSWGTMSTNKANGYRTATNKFKHFFYANDLESTIETPVGTWVFAAVTFDGTTRSIYINGQLDVSDTPTGVQVTGTNYKVGLAVTSYWDGNISNVRVFNTALTAAQVADLYNNPEKIVPTGVEDTALKLWLPMMEGAGTTAYDGSGNGNHGTISGATWTHGVGSPVAQTAVIDWNKGTNEVLYSEDFSQSNWGTSNMTKTTGQTDYIGGTNAVRVTCSSGVNAWFSQPMSGVAVGDVTIGAYIKGVSSSGTLSFSTAGTDRSNSRINYTTDWVFYEWTITETSSSPRIQIDNYSDGGGQEAIDVYFCFPRLVEGTNADVYVRTGATAQSSEVILPQGLTSGRDITGVNLFENVRKQGALNLDGNSWAEVHDNASLDFGTGSFTLEAWVKNSYENIGSSYNVILNLGDTVGVSSSIVSASGSILFFYGPLASGYSAANDGSWIHIVGTYDGTNATIYINGVQENQAARTAIDVSNNEVKGIGRDNVVARTYQDQIAQPRIYNRALTAEEVQRNYDAGKNIYTNS